MGVQLAEKKIRTKIGLVLNIVFVAEITLPVVEVCWQGGRKSRERKEEKEHRMSAKF